MIDAAFHAIFPRCAQECAHAIVRHRILRTVEAVAFQDISGEGGGFQTGVDADSAPPRKFA
jgi:hypothetical protein